MIGTDSVGRVMPKCLRSAVGMLFIRCARGVQKQPPGDRCSLDPSFLRGSFQGSLVQATDGRSEFIRATHRRFMLRDLDAIFQAVVSRSPQKAMRMTTHTTTTMR